MACTLRDEESGSDRGPLNRTRRLCLTHPTPSKACNPPRLSDSLSPAVVIPTGLLSERGLRVAYIHLWRSWNGMDIPCPSTLGENLLPPMVGFQMKQSSVLKYGHKCPDETEHLSSGFDDRSLLIVRERLGAVVWKALYYREGHQTGRLALPSPPLGVGGARRPSWQSAPRGAPDTRTPTELSRLRLINRRQLAPSPLLSPLIPAGSLPAHPP
ncbi:hypothetical protein AAFF_G00341880 [Aldrovandia affinis]|uniref:Uncharacterized protein n=1 Tax=Aldrovandia affinis TaxID=143900 RepID=A0AAD7WPN7_9TELE|nr:hypothetical protein AAFF_G00341880 [Aldrovandia affinis]